MKIREKQETTGNSSLEEPEKVMTPICTRKRLLLKRDQHFYGLCFKLLVLLSLLRLSSSAEISESPSQILTSLDTTSVSPKEDPTTPLTSANTSESDGIKRLWGVADTVAVVGILFQYHIPSDAFSGPIRHYEISAAGSPDLPNWLHFNSTTSILEGVPSELNIGQQYISVKAVGTNDNSFAKDVFSIDIMPDSHERSHVIPLKSYGHELHRCNPGEHITKMTITIDADVNKMEAVERIQLLNKIADYLMLNKGWIQFLPRRKENYLDLSAIFAGPGNVHQVETAGSVLQWQVGCNGNIDSQQQEQLNQLEIASRNGTLAQVLGVPVIGWHISTYAGTVTKRVRRQLALSYSTPVPALVPTRYSPYPDGDWINREDHFGPDDGEIQPESRIIPTMTSPVYKETRYDDYHSKGHHLDYPNPSRHPNRVKTKGRHNHHYGQATASPVYRLHPVTRSGIDLQGTIVPSPEIIPIHPTATLDEFSPTLLEEMTAVYPPFEKSEIFQSPVVATSSYTSVTDNLSPIYTDYSPSPSGDTLPAQVVPPGIDEHNTPPTLRHRIQSIAVTYGKIFHYPIPEHTFHDREDGSTRNLSLALFPAEEQLDSPRIACIRLNAKEQTIYGLPLKIDIGIWKFSVIATDRAGASVSENFEISVIQHKMDRKFNHEFRLSLEYDIHRFPHLVDRNILFVHKLRKLYKEGGMIELSNITLKEATQEYFVWSNDSFANTTGCAKKKMNALLSPMVRDKQEKHISHEFLKILSPEFRNPRLSFEWLGHCKERTPTSPTSPTRVTPSNRPPENRNRITQINATAGMLLNFTIPPDIFYDDQRTPLNLELRDHSQGRIKDDSWIKYDSTLNALVGLPLDSDKGDHKFHLVAFDNHNQSATDTFMVSVTGHSEVNIPSVQFSIILNYDYVKFNSDLSHKLKVLDKLAHLYGDPDGRYVTVMKIERGSVDFMWTNNTLSTSICQKKEIDNLVQYLFDHNKTVSTKLVKAFQPEFVISQANVIPGAACENDITPTSVTVVTVLPEPTKKTEQATSEDDIYISTIIPAVVIAAMLLLAAVVACLLYRKKRKGKMTMEDNSTFVNKGIPVIFADELEEKQDPTKAPMIMKEEKPPLPPPEYPRTSGGSSPSTPPLEHKDLSGHHPRSSPHHQQSRHPQHHGSSTFTPSSTLEHTENSPLYQPPPPFTTYRDSRMNRPKNTPTYRMPPPYVPP